MTRLIYFSVAATDGMNKTGSDDNSGGKIMKKTAHTEKTNILWYVTTASCKDLYLEISILSDTK